MAKRIPLSYTRFLTWLFILLLPSAGAANVNVGQVDVPNQAVSCPGPAGTFQDIPGLALTLKTSGRPVLVMFNFQVTLTRNTGIITRSVIDGGLPPDSDPRINTTRFVGAISDGEMTSLSFSRVYPLDRGTHTFGVQFSCQGSVSVGARWLTVYELK